jgi:hypothetical protein
LIENIVDKTAANINKIIPASSGLLIRITNFEAINLFLNTITEIRINKTEKDLKYVPLTRSNEFSKADENNNGSSRINTARM